MKIGKKYFFKNRRSIAFQWTVGILTIIFTQSLLLSVILLSGGVLSRAKENAYQSFGEKTVNRKNYLQGEMINHWSNIDLYAEQISGELTVLGEDAVPSTDEVDTFFEQASPILISMLRASAATDAFVILNDNTVSDTSHSALYFRDYDPLAGDHQNRDLRLLIGPTEIAQRNGAMTGDSWIYGLTLDDSNGAFYQNPYGNAHLSEDASLLGYWSPPFRLSPDGEPAITYSRPLFDQDGRLRGVIGIGVSMQHFSTLLPASELSGKTPLGYTLALRTAPESSICPLGAGNALQSQILTMDEPFVFSKYDKKNGIGSLIDGNAKKPVYACVRQLELYDHNTPFEHEAWYLVGFMEEKDLLNFTYRIAGLLLVSFVISIPLGAIYGILAGRRFTKPIIALVQRVRDSEESETIALGETGFAEIDELAGAIESANRKVMQQRDYDNLTGLCNNRLFKRRVTDLLGSDPKTLGIAAMIMMDLDDFKQVNDTYGHHWGDTYLKTAAWMFEQAYSEDAVVGRRSGDEFHVFLYGAETQDEILARVSKFYETLKEYPLAAPDTASAPIGVSTGLVWCEGFSETCDELLMRADETLYKAKRHKKGSVVVD
ncbi:MAG: diguanylate cyclase [Clostridium sp.]